MPAECPLDMESQYPSGLRAACLSGDLATLQHLKPLTPSSAIPTHELLETAALHGHASLVSFLLDSDSGQVPTITVKTLINAICSNSIPTFTVLLSHSVNINTRFGYQGNALIQAVYRNKADFVDFLLANGAGAATQHRFFGKDRLPAVAAQWASVEIMGKLIEKGMTVRETGALGRAAAEGRLEMVRSVLEAGVPADDPRDGTTEDAKEDNEGTPLQRAVRGGHLEVARCLVAYGANVELLDAEAKEVVTDL